MAASPVKHTGLRFGARKAPSSAHIAALSVGVTATPWVRRSSSDRAPPTSATSDIGFTSEQRHSRRPPRRPRSRWTSLGVTTPSKGSAPSSERATTPSSVHSCTGGLTEPGRGRPAFSGVRRQHRRPPRRPRRAPRRRRRSRQTGVNSTSPAEARTATAPSARAPQDWEHSACLGG